jgi:hypothetical protein
LLLDLVRQRTQLPPHPPYGPSTLCRFGSANTFPSTIYLGGAGSCWRGYNPETTSHIRRSPLIGACANQDLIGIGSTLTKILMTVTPCFFNFLPRFLLVPRVKGVKQRGRPFDRNLFLLVALTAAPFQHPRRVLTHLLRDLNKSIMWIQGHSVSRPSPHCFSTFSAAEAVQDALLGSRKEDPR